MRSDADQYLDHEDYPEELNVEEFNQISPKVLEGFPRGSFPLSLFRFRKKLNCLTPLYMAGDPVTPKDMEWYVHLANKGRLFFSRNDQEIYVRCAAGDLEAALDDPNLTPEDLAGLFVREIAKRQTAFYDNTIAKELDHLAEAVDMLSVYVGVDFDNADLLVSVAHRNRDRDRQRVNAGVVALAIYVHLNRDRVIIENLSTVAMGCFLYDIGMSRVSKLMTDKSGQLSTAERRKLREHPHRGCEMLKRLGIEDEEILEACAQHHERLDGTGYPMQLKGKEIGLYGRILAVADSYCAMVTDRPHSPRRNAVDAAVELLKMSKAYDKRICKALVEYLQGIPG
ncbi:HD-GYP domain-containing protein [Salidesulfovibrio brasiliensis]|uniref:HD-GYP domain-containing protein n=1 Tax=Salidesulfovibrio brasiliensis TaxID=221711 RepID=UPI0006D06C4D|nr:HD domain-containing phosphohydrolase [Salidesulfovibrio brasiliensis]